MDTVLAWMNAHWWVVLIVIIVMKVLNVITAHWSERKGLVKWCLFLIDILDVLKTTPPPRKLVNGGDK